MMRHLFRQYWKIKDEVGEEGARHTWRKAKLPNRLAYFDARIPKNRVVRVNIFRSAYDAGRRPHPSMRWARSAMRWMLMEIVDLAVAKHAEQPEWSEWNLAATVARLLDPYLEVFEEGQPQPQESVEPKLRAHLIKAMVRLPAATRTAILDLVEYFYEGSLGSRNVEPAGSFLRKLDTEMTKAAAAERRRRSPGQQSSSRKRRRRSSSPPSPRPPTFPRNRHAMRLSRHLAAGGAPSPHKRRRRSP